MSIRAISWALNVKIPATDKLVLIVMSDCANEEKAFTCWPSYAFLAERTSLTRRSCMSVIKRLMGSNLVSIVGKKGGTNLYKLHVGGEPISPVEVTGGELNSPASGEANSPVDTSGESPSPQVVNLLHPTGESPSPGTVKNRKGTVNKNKREPRKKIIPKDFKLNERMILYANEHNIDPEKEFENFIDWHKAKGTKHVDWEATWRTWVRKAVEFGRAKKATTEKFEDYGASTPEEEMWWVTQNT